MSEKQKNEITLREYVNTKAKEEGIDSKRFNMILNNYGIDRMDYQFVMTEFGVNNLSELINYVRDIKNAYRIGLFASQHSQRQQKNGGRPNSYIHVNPNRARPGRVAGRVIDTYTGEKEL
jgi:hypothetical protein